ncbi:MAG: bifunctional hydroxymethylpyrimidine kinase/phosphomethylpyrimidine kinase [Synergistales bacterium]|nr:bifunctional hydroxymethylpyrimidine kinase/phosphomethylpyrimidine kinase [Synergistales bacterium]
MALYRGIALTIAGSDSGGGAGIQADLKTFAALKIFGTTAVTAVTSQNSLGVQDVYNLPAACVAGQIESVCADMAVGAAKTGMLSRPETIAAVRGQVERFGIDSLVVDPVMVAQSGDPLIAEEAVDALVQHLIPRALLVTPNIPEAERMSGMALDRPDKMEEAALAIADMGPRGVLLKGGHLPGETVTDVLVLEGKATVLESPRIDTGNTHGTGCTLSAAIAAELAAGCGVREAVDRGRAYLQAGLRHGFRPGRGYGPPGHALTMPWVEEVRP